MKRIRSSLIAICVMAVGIVGSMTMPRSVAAPVKIPPKIYRIAMVSYIPGAEDMERIKRDLAIYGYNEGVNTVYMLRSGVRNGDIHSGAKEVVEHDVADIVAWQPDLIIALNTNAVVPLKENPDAARFPVFFWGDDGVESGFAKSYRHPGGNMTGYSSRPGRTTLYLRILKSSIPNFKHIGHLYTDTYSVAPTDKRELAEAAKMFGVEVKTYPCDRLADVEQTFAQMKRDGMQAVKIGPSEMFSANGGEVGRLALKYGLAAVGQESVVAGGGVASVVVGRDWEAIMPTIDQILKGAKPADIPIQRNWPPYLTINLKSARQLGLKVPDEIIDEADRVIE